MHDQLDKAMSRLRSEQPTKADQIPSFVDRCINNPSYSGDRADILFEPKEKFEQQGRQRRDVRRKRRPKGRR